MKKKSFIVLMCSALLALGLFAGCDCCEKKHHSKCGDKTCKKCCCQPCNDNSGVIVTEEDALLEVAPETTPANPPAK